MKFVSLKSSLSVMSFIRVVTSVSARGQASLSASVSVRAAADLGLTLPSQAATVLGARICVVGSWTGGSSLSTSFDFWCDGGEQLFIRQIIRSPWTVDGRTQLKNGEHRLWMSLRVAFVRVLCLQIGHGKGATMVVDKWGARIFVGSC